MKSIKRWLADLFKRRPEIDLSINKEVVVNLGRGEKFIGIVNSVEYRNTQWDPIHSKTVVLHIIEKASLHD